MAKHNEVGKWGEDIVCDYLRQKGYTVVERNWREGHYELDVIALKGNRIVFGEVKTRSDRDCDPFDAIDARKMHRMLSAANVYIQSHDVKQEPQCDVFGVTGSPDDYKLEHLEDAFLPTIQTYK